MKVTNQKGFSVSTVLILILVMATLVLAGWYVWQKNEDSQSKNPTNASANTRQVTAYRRTTTVPSDWKTYQDPNYPVSFSYPSTWIVVPDSKGNPTMYDYEIGAGATQQNFDALMGIKQQSLAITVEEYKKNFLENSQYHPKLLSQKQLTIDGNPAQEFRYAQIISSDGEQKQDGIERQYFVYFNGNTYTLPVVHETDRPYGITAADSLMFFEGIQID